MSKKLLGSLTVASAAPTPQELPPAARLAALIDRAALGVDHSTTASILRTKLGSYVQPVSGGGFVAKTMLRQGEHFVLNGHTLTGKLAQMVVKDPVRDFVPRWAQKLAAVAVFAYGLTFTNVINEFITGAGLPVDPSVDWDARLNNIFQAAGVKNEEERKDAIQDAIISLFLTRHVLERFDPNQGEGRGGQETPLDGRLSAFLTNLFKWQATGKSEAGDFARRRQFDQGFTIDEPLGDEGEATLGDLTPGDYVDQEAEAHSESVIRSLDQFMGAFGDYLQKARGGNLAKTCTQLLKLIISAHDAAEVKARWPIETGTSYSNMRRILPIVAEELLKFSETSKAPNIHLTQLLNKLRQRLIEQAGADAQDPTPEPEPEPQTPEPVEDTEQVGTKAKEMQAPKTSAITICASAEDFMTKLAAYVHELRKEAAPKVVEQSILYLRLGGNRANPRFMDISFYSPKLRTLPGAGGYKIEVGDWGQDKSLPERKIRQQVGTFVIPMMRGDVLDEDHDLLEKVIRRLRSIVWENAVEYFQIPLDQKPEWRNTIKMDIARLLDTKVTIQDPEQGTIEVAASLTEGAHGRKAARKIAGGYLAEDDSPEGFHVVAQGECGTKRATALNIARTREDNEPGDEERWEPVQVRPIWNEEKQQWEPGDKTPGGLLGGQPARYGSKRAKALAAGAFPDESKLPKGRIVSEIIMNHGVMLYVYKAVEPRNNRPYFLVKGDGPNTQMGSWLTEEQVQPYLKLDRHAKQAAFMSVAELERLGKEAALYESDRAEYIGAQKATPELLAQAFEKAKTINWTNPDKLFLHVSYDGHNDPSTYGSAKWVSQSDLAGRKYRLENVNGKIGIHFLDEKHDPRTFSKVQARSLGGELNLTPAEQTDFAPDPDHMTTSSLKEATVSAKFAALKRIAAENPQAIAEAIDGLKSQLSEQLNNLTILQENLGIVAPVEGAEVKEGAPMEVQEVEGEEKFAGLKRLAAEEPAQLEEAFGEFYLAMDKVMAQTEALADNLDITLPDAAPVDVEEEAAEEGESVPEEIAEGGSDTDDVPHGEQPAATEEPATVE